MRRRQSNSGKITFTIFFLNKKHINYVILQFLVSNKNGLAGLISKLYY